MDGVDEEHDAYNVEAQNGLGGAKRIPVFVFFGGVQTAGGWKCGVRRIVLPGA